MVAIKEIQISSPDGKVLPAELVCVAPYIHPHLTCLHHRKRIITSDGASGAQLARPTRGLDVTTKDPARSPSVPCRANAEPPTWIWLDARFSWRLT